MIFAGIMTRYALSRLQRIAPRAIESTAETEIGPCSRGTGLQYVPSLMSTVTAEDFAGIVSLRLAAERLTLARRWLDRLNALLSVGPNEIFPSEQLLDHIPTLIGDIAAYLRAPEHEEIAANATVIEKARELGVLRHQQQASVHQLLREYEILSEILEQFVVDETERMGLRPSPAACFEVVRRLTQSARTLMRTTVDTFVSRYTATIQEHNDRIDTFNRLASHELRSPIGTLLFAAAMVDTDVVRTDRPVSTRSLRRSVQMRTVVVVRAEPPASDAVDRARRRAD